MGNLSAAAQRRAASITRLKDEAWDLLVIGGGISGAGVAREAARRGWKVALIEQRDFAWGTSSRSSKMVHGGLRYLKEGQIGLTLHSVRERERLMREAPELVEPLSFLFSDCAGRKPGRWLFQLGLKVYDLMAGRRTHAYINADAARALVPGLAPPALKGAMTYQDAVTDDTRLVTRVLAEAQCDGALALNYVCANQLILENGQAAGVHARDAETGQTFDIRAKAVVNATGAWADRLRGAVGGQAKLRPLRGSHLVVPAWRLPVSQCVSLMHPQDGRPVYFYPWEGVTLVGTTDLDHSGDINTEATITQAEMDYLLAAVNDQMPGALLRQSDVIACYAGVRPVVAGGSDGGGSGNGASSASKDASKMSRDHVALLESGLVTLTGGKLTTFRLMAQDALVLAAPLAGKIFQPDNAIVFRAVYAFPVGISALNDRYFRRLQARYGADAGVVAKGASSDELQCVPGTTTLWLELRIAAEHEAVVHLDDLLLRRTRLGLLLPNGAITHIDKIRQLCQPALQWDDATWQAEIARYIALVDKYYSLPKMAANPSK